MLNQLLITVAALTVMMSGWLGLQAWARRLDGLSADCDALEGRIGCFGCALSGKCKSLSDAPNRRRQYPENTRPE